MHRTKWIWFCEKCNVTSWGGEIKSRANISVNKWFAPFLVPTQENHKTDASGYRFRMQIFSFWGLLMGAEKWTFAILQNKLMISLRHWTLGPYSGACPADQGAFTSPSGLVTRFHQQGEGTFVGGLHRYRPCVIIVRWNIWCGVVIIFLADRDPARSDRNEKSRSGPLFGQPKWHCQRGNGNFEVQKGP